MEGLLENILDNKNFPSIDSIIVPDKLTTAYKDDWFEKKYIPNYQRQVTLIFLLYQCSCLMVTKKNRNLLPPMIIMPGKFHLRLKLCQVICSENLFGRKC